MCLGIYSRIVLKLNTNINKKRKVNYAHRNGTTLIGRRLHKKKNCLKIHKENTFKNLQAEWFNGQDRTTIKYIGYYTFRSPSKRRQTYLRGHNCSKENLCYLKHHFVTKQTRTGKIRTNPKSCRIENVAILAYTMKCHFIRILYVTL